MLKTISISDRLSSAHSFVPLIDVRAPKEYEKGHIPGALNIPLFDDDERAVVGTLYKQKGKEAALMKGLDFVGPKLSAFVRQAQQIAPEKKICVHCWRGGMRSQSLAKLWQAAGFEVSVIQGGYKAYRQKIHQDLAKPLKLITLAGKTGSGKTELLKNLNILGEQMIDLEGIARHKGSVYGGIGQHRQPSTEQFENNLYECLRRLDKEKRIWIEDEGMAIGEVFIPSPFWEQMKKSEVIAIEVSSEIRVERLVDEYAQLDQIELAEATSKIKKRLGGLRFQEAMTALAEKDYKSGATIALDYYDRAYANCLKNRSSSRMTHLTLMGNDYHAHARKLLEVVGK